MILVDLNRLIATPWKNGGGVTRELAAYPDGAGMHDFIWRISIADVAQSGAFSIFPGIDRIITLVDGDGMRLEFNDGRRHDLTTAFAPYPFRGEDPVHAQLIKSPCSDFNLMLRREAVTGSVDAWHHPATINADDLVALVCVSGAWDINHADGSRYGLAEQQALTGTCSAGRISANPIVAGSTLLGVFVMSKHENGISDDE